MHQLHFLQLQILKKLVFANGLTFTELKPNAEIPNNQFEFHLKTLQKDGLVRKDSNLYQLTDAGKDYANRIDQESTQITQQAKLSIWLGTLRQEHKEETEYLIYTRLKNPFFGCQGFPAGKVRRGETILESAAREFTEETGLTGKPEVVLIRHYLVHKQATNLLVEDKIMFLCRILNPTGTLRGSEEGKYEWVKESEIPTYITKPFETMADVYQIHEILKVFKGQVRFDEIKHWTEKF